MHTCLLRGTVMVSLERRNTQVEAIITVGGQIPTLPREDENNGIIV